jgi:hypothetical protein
MIVLTATAEVFSTNLGRDGFHCVFPFVSLAGLLKSTPPAREKPEHNAPGQKPR